MPEGGAGRLTDALVARLRAAGGTLVTGCPVERVVVEGGRARGVALPGGTFVGARRGVIAAGDAEALFHRLVGPDHLPARFLERLARFQRSDGTVKVDWALRAPIPWKDPEVGRAGTVHLADSLDELTLTAAQLATGAVPDRPFVILGQMTTSDPTRSPPGTESAWAYTHIPQAAGDDPAVVAAVAERVEDRIETHAPGFRDLVAARHVAGPTDLERLDPALVGGDIGGGTQQLHQQLVFRPVTGLARPETPITGLYLGSASAHPGGGVHGACGNNAARAAIAHDRWRPGRADRRR